MFCEMKTIFRYSFINFSKQVNINLITIRNEKIIYCDVNYDLHNMCK